MIGLRMPFLSEADPELAGEGSLDPLRLAPLADRLADEIAPGVTARMSRVRFLTAIAVAAASTEALDEIVPADGVTPPYLAFEWHLVEALARRSSELPLDATDRLPGINKARAVIGGGSHLSAASYLKVPKVFGFVGIYKRLARSLQLVDDDLELDGAGDRLVRIWEREHQLLGFVDRTRGTDGAAFAQEISNAVRGALLSGSVEITARSRLWSRLVDSLRPDGAGRREKTFLRSLLESESEPIRREVVQGLARLPDGTEEDALRALRARSSSALRDRLEAIDAYERVAELLLVAFNAARWLSTGRSGAVDAAAIALHPAIERSCRELPASFAKAVGRLDPLGLAVDFELELGDFEMPLASPDFVHQLMARHEGVQRDKPPGKRPWFDRDSDGYSVRLAYELRDEPGIERRYVHPYRVSALRSFLMDLS
jgi:hypothetical protein